MATGRGEEETEKLLMKSLGKHTSVSTECG